MRRIKPKKRPAGYQPPPKEHNRIPRPLHERQSIERGFGDWAAWALAKGYVIPFLKLTPRRYRRLKVYWGFADACNCAERKAGMNRFGRTVVRPIRLAIRWLRKALLPAPPAE